MVALELVGPEIVGRLDLVFVALGVTLLVVGLVAAAAGVLRIVAVNYRSW